MATHSLLTLFHFDALAKIITALVVFIGLVVGSFSVRYMQGDKHYYKFLGQLGLLVLSVITMVASDHLLLLLIAWGVSNILLVQLMIHKRCWTAAANAGWLAAKSFILGYLCLIFAFGLLYVCTKQTSIQTILQVLDISNPWAIVAMVLIIVAAMSQSAIWPFQSWLISSLNSPTPVSAMMHAGLVNGGGFLLVRFAPLYYSQSTILRVIFVLGLGTALVGALWKLMQNDVKRMLACSTMSQMGFMFVQCGLGLFPAAVAHFCWHGLFKANLFLSSNSASQEKRYRNNSSPTFLIFLLAIAGGCVGSYLFSLTSHHTLGLVNDTTVMLTVVIFIASTQCTMQLLQSLSWKRLPIILGLVGFMTGVYGYSVSVIESILSPLHLMHPQPLNIFHYVGLISLSAMWLIMLFKDKLSMLTHFSYLLPNMYVKALNASQPHPSTITAQRNQYQYE